MIQIICLCSAINLPLTLFHRRLILHAQHNLLKEIKYCTLLDQLMNKAIKSNFITKWMFYKAIVILKFPDLHTCVQLLNACGIWFMFLFILNACHVLKYHCFSFHLLLTDQVSFFQENLLKFDWMQYISEQKNKSNHFYLIAQNGLILQLVNQIAEINHPRSPFLMIRKQPEVIGKLNEYD